MSDKTTTEYWPEDVEESPLPKLEEADEYGAGAKPPLVVISDFRKALKNETIFVEKAFIETWLERLESSIDSIRSEIREIAEEIRDLEEDLS